MHSPQYRKDILYHRHILGHIVFHHTTSAPTFSCSVKALCMTSSITNLEINVAIEQSCRTPLEVSKDWDGCPWTRAFPVVWACNALRCLHASAAHLRSRTLKSTDRSTESNASFESKNINFVGRWSICCCSNTW